MISMAAGFADTKFSNKGEIRVAKASACKVEGCPRPVRAKGYCRIHYNKWRKGELGKARYKICKAEGCRKKRFLKAYCEEHYKSEYLKKAAGEQSA